MSGITVRINWNDKAEKNLPQHPVILNSFKEIDLFYADAEMQELILVERVLSLCSQTDFQIINQLLKGSRTDQIAKICNLVESGVRYRINRIVEKGGLKDRNNLVELFKKYFVE